jgi:5-hydroxyisourate hydrolase-like protein (transthyretin family)
MVTGGQISGTVTDAATHGPAPNVWVKLYDANRGWITDTCTASDGSYSFGSLTAGTYYVEFAHSAWDVFPGTCPGPSNYLDQFYNGESTLATADPISVAANSMTSGIDASMVAAGQITGALTDASTHQPLIGMEVDVFDSAGNYVASTCTAFDGSYQIGGLPTGSYHVGFGQPYSACGYVGPAGPPGYASQYYNDKPSLAASDPVAVTAGSTTTGIDAGMVLTGAVSGTVTDASSHLPAANVDVIAYDSAGTPAATACTGTDGSYTLTYLPSGSYRVGFATHTSACVGAASYQSQYYSNRSSLATADPVAVSPNSTTPGIDAALVPAGPTTNPLTVAVAGQGSGTVTSAPAGISCPAACSAPFASGTTVTLTETPSAGSAFTGWSGAACSGTAGTCTVQMDSAQNVTANFGPITPPPTLSKNPPSPKPSCSLRIISAKVLLKAPRRHHGARPSVGTMSVRVDCTQASSLDLEFTVSIAKHGKTKARKVVFSLHVSEPAGAETVVVKLPRSALKALSEHLREPLTIALSASNANGVAKATASGRLHTG